MSSEFRATGSADVTEGYSFDMRPPQLRLRDMVAREVKSKPFSELYSISFDHDGGQLAGHVLLDTLEEQGFGLDDFDAVGALTAAAVPLASAMLQAAAARGQQLDAFMMDFVYPSIKGPSIKGKRVILLDAWLSEKSYVQTSSLVTLRNGNELDLDFSIIDAQGGEAVAIAALVGGVPAKDGEQPTVNVTNIADGSRRELPFVEVYEESALRALDVDAQGK